MLYEYLLISLLIVASALTVYSITVARRASKYYRAVKLLLEQSSGTVAKKPRKRYIVFAVICEDKVTRADVETAIKEKFVEYFGQSTLHKASPQVVFYDESTGRGVIRVLHTCTNHLVAVMGIVKKVGNKDCIVVPTRVTGTLKKAQEYMHKLRI